MLARKLLLGCLTLVLLTRTLHCVYTDALSCASAVASSHASQPLSDPSESDPHESGCLCKGILPKAPCPLSALEAQRTLPVQIVMAPAALISTLPLEATVRDFPWRPPRSGSFLRALLASWQI